MEADERRLAMDRLVSSEARVLQLVEGLTPKQWTFRQAPERWSIAENIEHLIAFENFVIRRIAEAIAGPTEPDKKAQAAGKESLVLGLADSRSTRFSARVSVRPVGKWTDPTELIGELRQARAQTLAFVADTQADLRGHFFAHISFGDLDCYQWLAVLSQHALRHSLQIEEIKADPAYPAR
jgi:uncharacterized damage-inducible protein DinB